MRWLPPSAELCVCLTCKRARQSSTPTTCACLREKLQSEVRSTVPKKTQKTSKISNHLPPDSNFQEFQIEMQKPKQTWLQKTLIHGHIYNIDTKIYMKQPSEYHQSTVVATPCICFAIKPYKKVLRTMFLIEALRELTSLSVFIIDAMTHPSISRIVLMHAIVPNQWFS